MSIPEFKRKVNDWFKATKGLVTPPQQRPHVTPPRVILDRNGKPLARTPGTRNWKDIRFKKAPNRTNQFHQNSAQTRTETRPR